MKLNKLKTNIIAYLFLLPALVLIGFYLVYPTLTTIRMSFFEWNGFSKSGAQFVGLKNYVGLLGSKKFTNALKNNVFYTVCTVIGTVVVGMLVAVPIDRRICGSKVFKFSFYIPAMMSVTVVGVLFENILDPNKGLLNSFLCSVGLEKLTRGWLSDPKLAMWMIIFVAVWQYSSVTMLLFLAAMASVSEDIQEAATLDGVNEISRFFRITLPIIKRPVLVVVMLQMIYGFKAYDLIQVMTKGGPGTTTQVLSQLIVQTGFEYGEYGMACTVSVVMLVLISIVSVFYIRQSGLGEQMIE